MIWLDIQNYLEKYKRSVVAKGLVSGTTWQMTMLVFLILQRFVEQTLKIQCSSYNEDYIKRRRFSRMRSTNTTTYADHLRYLKSHAHELEQLRNALTLNVTEFFRGMEIWDTVRTAILSSPLRERKRISI